MMFDFDPGFVGFVACLECFERFVNLVFGTEIFIVDAVPPTPSPSDDKPTVVSEKPEPQMIIISKNPKPRTIVSEEDNSSVGARDMAKINQRDHATITPKTTND